MLKHHQLAYMSFMLKNMMCPILEEFVNFRPFTLFVKSTQDGVLSDVFGLLSLMLIICCR